MRAILVSVLFASAVAAQPVAPEQACTYSDCAIRLEAAFFRGTEIVRGLPGQEEVVGRFGLFGGGLIDHVEDVPQAVDHAVSSRRYMVGGFAIVAAGGAVLGALAAADNLGSDGTALVGSSTPFLLGAIAVTVVGSAFTLKAQREQSRAVWTYNQAVARN
ncbi:hypothetical protein [Rubrivirga sp.]|uniref:hypothetical protein n=1 Tax=Rubrivirga sp. TaxID=1885344 RepID=UPI003C7176AA